MDTALAIGLIVYLVGIWVCHGLVLGSKMKQFGALYLPSRSLEEVDVLWFKDFNERWDLVRNRYWGIVVFSNLFSLFSWVGVLVSSSIDFGHFGFMREAPVFPDKEEFKREVVRLLMESPFRRFYTPLSNGLESVSNVSDVSNVSNV